MSTPPYVRLVLLVLAAAVAGARAQAQEESPAAGRGQLLALDDELRAKFGKTVTLPEAKRKMPAATVAKFDWVKVTGNTPTPIHYQGGIPSCVAQACVATLEWNWQIRNGTKTKLVFSPQPILDRLNKGGDLNYVDALDQLLLNGTAEIATYPYTGQPKSVPAKAKTPYRIIGYGRVGERGEQPSVESIKLALLEHGPLVTGIYSTDAFRAYRGGVFAENARDIPKDKSTNHAVVIVGWDDKRGKGSWIVQNSWGATWGEAGGAWVEYGCNNVGHFTYWVRAQSTQYHLEPDAHQHLGSSAAPFHRWPSAKDLSKVK